MTNKPSIDALKAAYKAIDEKFGFDTIVLDISGVSIVADYFIIASANNAIQLKAISEAVEAALKKHGITLNHSEGVSSARWVLLDFGGVVVHLFCQEEREYYKLEMLWGDAPVVQMD